MASTIGSLNKKNWNKEEEINKSTLIQCDQIATLNRSKNLYLVSFIFASEICFSWIEIFGFRIKSLFLLVLLALIFMRISLVSKNIFEVLKVPNRFIMIMLVSLILVLVTNVHNDKGFYDVLRYFSFIIPSILIPYYIRDFQSLYKLIKIILVLISISVFFQILQALFGKIFVPYYYLSEGMVAELGKIFMLESRERMPGLSLTGLHQAYMLSYFLPFLVSFLLINYKNEIIRTAVILFLFCGVLLTFTRTGIFFGISIPIVVLLLNDKKFKYKFVILIPIFIAVLLNLFINTAGKNYDRFSSMSIRQHLNQRIGLIIYGFEIGYRNNFWLGNRDLNKDSYIFFDTYKKMRPYNIPFLGKVFPPNIDYPHNIFADTLIKYGFIFLVCSLYLIYYLGTIFRKLLAIDSGLNMDSKMLVLGLVFSYFSFLGNAFFHNIDITTDFNFWLLTGILFSFYNIENTTKIEKSGLCT